MKRGFLFLFIICFMLAAAVCTAEPGVSDSEIKIGMVNAQSGPASGLGKGMLSGAGAVFREVNEKGGIGGRKINLVVADDGYEPDKTVDTTLRMIEVEKVFALFGYVGTPTANAVIPIVKDTKVPLVGLFTGAMTLRKPVTHEIINIRASYDDEGEKLVDNLLKAGAKKIGIFYQDDGFGMAVLSATEKALKKRSMEVAAKGTFQRNTLAVKAGFASIISANPDAVVMVGPYTPLAEFIRVAKEEGLKARLATVSFVGTDSLVKLVGDQGNGVIISQVVPFPEDISIPVVKECSEIVKKYSNETLGFVNLEGCITAKAIVKAMESMGKNITREGLISAFEGMKGVDIGGMVFRMGQDNHQASDAVYLTEIKNGKITSISEITK